MSMLTRMMHSFPRRAIYIELVSPWHWMIMDTFDTIKEEFNLREDSVEEISSWIIKDILNDTMMEQNTRVLDHYAYDEAALVKERLSPNSINMIKTAMKNRFKFAKDTDMKVMVLGTEMLVAVRMNNE